MDTWVLDQNAGLSERANPTATGEESRVLQSLNTSWLTDGLLCLRRGMTAQILTDIGMTKTIRWMGRHVTNDGLEELWAAAANNASTSQLARRPSAGGAWVPVTMIDLDLAVTANSLYYMEAVSHNGKFFFGYIGSENRLHVWDGTAFRRVGIQTPAALTVADTGAGAYAATPRRYRTAQRIKNGTDIVAQSELSAAVSFTPSGGGTAARITKSATIDSATHWVVYGLISTAGDVYDLYEELAEIAVGTTTYDDSVNPIDYSGDAPPQLGINVPPPSAQFLVSDGSRLIMAGSDGTTAAAGETVAKRNRVYFTRPLGSSDVGDDESIPNTTTLKYTLDVGDAGDITGLAGPFFGEIYVFKRRSIYKMVPTGNDVTPYRLVLITSTCGALRQAAIVALGNSGCAFADATTVYMLGASSEPIPISEAISVSFSYSALSSNAWVAYDQWDKKLYVFSSTDSNTGHVFDTTKLRWGTFTFSGGAGANRAVMATQDSGAGGQRLIFGGGTSGGVTLILATGAVLPKDDATAVTATVRVRRMPAPGYKMEVFAPTIWYRAPDATGTLTLTVTYERQDGVTYASGNVTLPATTSAADASGTRYAVNQYTVENLGMADATVADVTFTLSQSGGDGNVTSPPSIDVAVIPYKVQAPVAR